MIPYATQWIDDDDISAVIETLRSDRLTTGPAVKAFEDAFAEFTGAAHAVAVSSGTAALHAAMLAAGIGPGDEAIVPAITFAATANCVVYQGGTPVFADVREDTLLIDPSDVEAKITSSTRAVIAVDYAGQPADYDDLHTIVEGRNITLVADACHAPGGAYRDRPTGSLADLSTFSFHPVKHIACGEGGMIVTDDADAAERMTVFRNHGITSDYRAREEKCSWEYEMESLGFNYRITDIQCALGLSQLKKLPAWVERRRQIARRYDEAFRDVHCIEPLSVLPGRRHAYHLYVVRVKTDRMPSARRKLFDELRSRGIMVNVHYIPVYLHPYYRRTLGTGPGMCPVAECAYEEILSLPMYPKLSDEEVGTVIGAVLESCRTIGLTD